MTRKFDKQTAGELRERLRFLLFEDNYKVVETEDGYVIEYEIDGEVM